MTELHFTQIMGHDLYTILNTWLFFLNKLIYSLWDKPYTDLTPFPAVKETGKKFKK